MMMTIMDFFMSMFSLLATTATLHVQSLEYLLHFVVSLFVKVHELVKLLDGLHPCNEVNVGTEEEGH